MERLLLATRCDTRAATDGVVLCAAYGDAVHSRLLLVASVLHAASSIKLGRDSELLFEGFRMKT